MNAKICGLFGLMAALSMLTGCETMSNRTDKIDADIAGPEVGKLAFAVDKPVTTAMGDERPFATLIAKHATANNVPVDLAHAVVYSESSYRPNATGAAGEIGLMQLRIGTARMVGFTGSAKDLYDPATNIKYGMKYLGGAHRLAGGATCGTILRYNAGHAARSMNPVSRRYCDKVARLLAE